MNRSYLYPARRAAVGLVVMLALAACDKPAPKPVDATPAPGGSAPSSQDSGPVQQK